MGINNQTDLSAELQIGPTDLGMVRIYVAGDGIDLPMDFTPEEAHEIAEELIDAATRAAAQHGGEKSARPGQKSGKSGDSGAPSKNRNKR